MAMSLLTKNQQWWKTIENGAQNVSNRLVELANIKPGDKVLDIATGIGEPAITAAKRVGSSGCVKATDLSPQMLSIAKQRAASMGLENMMEFKDGDTETIELPASSFNAVLCRWGLMFLPNPSSALSNINRIMIPGGYLAAAVWDEVVVTSRKDAAINHIGTILGLTTLSSANKMSSGQIFNPESYLTGCVR